MSTMIEDLQFLAAARAQYCHFNHADGGPAPSEYWGVTETDRMLHTQHRDAEQLASILGGTDDGWGWLPTWKEPEWEDRAAERAARRAEAEALRAEIEHWVADYHRIFRIPNALPPNLTLATRALALLHAEVGL